MSQMPRNGNACSGTLVQTRSAPRAAQTTEGQAHHHWRVIDMVQGTCSVEGCERAHKAHGFCSSHYNKWRRYGDPLAGSFQQGKSAVERFVEKVAFDPEPDGCWHWLATTDRGGYGRFTDRPATWAAHRFAYELWVGPIPEGLQLDHLCRNRACVNPAHLEPVTQQENLRRGRGGSNMSDKTHCPQGHPYDEANTYWYPNQRKRKCRTCMAVWSAAQREKVA